jgi:hypothetical protein
MGCSLSVYVACHEIRYSAMSPIPRPVNCERPKLVKLVKFKGEDVIHYRCETCGAHVTMPEQ